MRVGRPQLATERSFRGCIPQPLLVSEQRSPLAIFADDLSSREGVTAKQSRNANSQAQDEEQPTNRERKDPLQLQDRKFAQELTNTSGCTPLAKPSITKCPLVDLQNASTDSAKPIV